MRSSFPHFDRRLFLALPTIFAIAFVAILFACTTPMPIVESSSDLTEKGQALATRIYQPGELPATLLPQTPSATPTIPPWAPPTREPGAPVVAPTPDPERIIPTLRAEEDYYVVAPGDSLGIIARRFNVPWQQIAGANELVNPDLLEPGQGLVIPAPLPQAPGSDFKLIPDSELVNGPVSALFDLYGFLQSRDSYLLRVTDDVDSETLTGAQVVAKVAEQFSVAPRLLLAVLEHQSGWVTQANPDPHGLNDPLGLDAAGRKGLYSQLTYAANQLNAGFYLWRANGLAYYLLADGAMVPASGTINAGTAGVQYYYSGLYGRSDWDRAISADGFFATYTNLFGYPFDLAFEPLLPADLAQPPMQLPFEPGDAWSYTGGPHGGWASGSGWAALDFAPPGEAAGCVSSDAWVVAVADGLIVRSAGGAVVQDLDGDGLEQTGWSVLYMHIESRDRVPAGTFVRAGERIGHASCEGGFSNGTHVHLARRYNGEWIPADGGLPFNLDGWVSSGAGSEYDGYLTRDEQTIEAWVGRSPANQIQR